MRALRIGIGISLILTLVLALPVSAHQISQIETRCEAGLIHVEGTGFESNLPVTVSLTGPNGYDESTLVTTDAWEHDFPLGVNGSYRLDWPNSEEFAREFVVQCTSTPTPTPTASPPSSPAPTPTSTPTAKPSVGPSHTPMSTTTPPPSDTAPEAVVTTMDNGGRWIIIGMIAAAILTGLWLTRRRSKD